MDGCKNNLEKSSTAKEGGHVSSDFSMSPISSFKDIKNKHDVYKGEDCIKKFCECLKKHERRIINFKKNKYNVAMDLRY